VAYATHADVEKLIRATLGKGGAAKELSSSTTVTVTDAEAIIADVEGEVNVALSSQRVLVPVTEPAHFLASVKALVTNGAAARVLRSFFPDSKGPGEQPAFAYWQALYDKALLRLYKGEGIPNDAVLSGGRVVAETHLSENPDQDVDLGAHANPFFTGAMKG
jgi:hypothetical protein